MSAKQKDVGSSPAHDQKIFCAVFFSAWGDIILQIFLLSPKGPPFIFFLFSKRMCIQKLPKAPLYFFRHYVTYRKPKKNSKKFKKIRIFSIYFSRGYCRKEYLTH